MPSAVGDRLLDRRRDEALDQVGRRAGIGRGDGDRRVRQLRILPDRQAGSGLEADQQDQQADDQRQHRALDEDVGEPCDPSRDAGSRDALSNAAALAAAWDRRRGGRRDLRRQDRSRRPRADLQLELADRDHAVAGLQAREDFGACRRSRLPVRTKVRTAVRLVLPSSVLLLGDQEDRVAIERVVDRGFRHGDDRRLVRQHHRRASTNMPGFRMSFGIGDRRLHADVARVGGDLRLDRGDLALEVAAGIGVDRDCARSVRP